MSGTAEYPPPSTEVEGYERLYTESSSLYDHTLPLALSEAKTRAHIVLGSFAGSHEAYRDGVGGRAERVDLLIDAYTGHSDKPFSDATKTAALIIPLLEMSYDSSRMQPDENIEWNKLRVKDENGNKARYHLDVFLDEITPETDYIDFGVDPKHDTKNHIRNILSDVLQVEAAARSSIREDVDSAEQIPEQDTWISSVTKHRLYSPIEIAKLLELTNLESTIIKAVDTLDRLMYPPDGDEPSIEDVRKAMNFYAPAADFLNYKELAIALRDASVQVAFTMAGNEYRDHLDSAQAVTTLHKNQKVVIEGVTETLIGAPVTFDSTIGEEIDDLPPSRYVIPYRGAGNIYDDPQGIDKWMLQEPLAHTRLKSIGSFALETARRSQDGEEPDKKDLMGLKFRGFKDVSNVAQAVDYLRRRITRSVNIRPIAAGSGASLTIRSDDPDSMEPIIDISRDTRLPEARFTPSKDGSPMEYAAVKLTVEVDQVVKGRTIHVPTEVRMLTKAQAIVEESIGHTSLFKARIDDRSILEEYATAVTRIAARSEKLGEVDVLRTNSQSHTNSARLQDDLYEARNQYRFNYLVN